MAIFMKTVAATVVNLARICPGCKKKQVVPKSKGHKTVSCRFCGADIPPKAPDKK